MMPLESESGVFVYEPVFTFSDSTGLEHTKTSRQGYGSWPFGRGDTVSVLYDPANPDRAKIDCFDALWFGPLVIAVFGLVFVAFGVGLMRSRRAAVTGIELDRRGLVKGSPKNFRVVRANSSSILYPFHQQGRLLRYFGGLALLVMVTLWWVVAEDWGLRIFTLLFAALGFGLLTEQFTVVKPGTGTISQEGWLLGWIPIYRRRWPVNDFTAVAVVSMYDSDRGEIAYYSVHLSRQTGWPRVVRHGTYSEVLCIAEDLSKETGLPVNDTCTQ